MENVIPSSTYGVCRLQKVPKSASRKRRRELKINTTATPSFVWKKKTVDGWWSVVVTIGLSLVNDDDDNDHQSARWDSSRLSW